MAGMTATGLVTDRYQQIFDRIKDQLFTELSPNLDLSENSDMGIFLATVARSLADVHEVISEVYDAQIIDKAEGYALDELTALNAIYRYVDQPTTGYAEFTGDVGASVPSTTRLRTTSGFIFYPSDSFVIRPSRCIETQVRVNNIKADEDYVIIIDNISYTYRPDSVVTTEKIITELAKAINGGIVAKAQVLHDDDKDKTPYLRIYKDEGDKVERTKYMIITATSYMTFGKTTCYYPVVSEDKGAIIGLAGTLIEIDTQVTGLDSVYNRYDLTTGRDKETDTELRERYLSSLIVTGVSTLDAIVSNVERVSGVSDVIGTENDTEVPVDGIPAKSFKITVVGGDVNEIAQAIWESKPAGIRAFGTTSGEAIDSRGGTHTLFFARPIPRYAFVKLSYTIYDEEALSVEKKDLQDVIKLAINEYGRTLKVGGDIIPNRIYGYVYKAVQGIVVNEIKVATSPNQQTKPDEGEYTTERISIAADQYTVWESNQYDLTEEPQ